MAIKITLGELRKIVAEELAAVKASDIFQGGLGDNMTVADVAKKHGVPIEQITNQIKKGVNVEKEHTNDIRSAAEIALDHLTEDPIYYDKLDKMENPTKEGVLDKEFWRAIKRVKPKPKPKKTK